MISKEEVQKIAKLARLSLTEKEVFSLQKDMTEILDYFKLLTKVKDKAEPACFNKENTRGDVVALSKTKLLDQVPDIKGDYVKVKTIFND